MVESHDDSLEAFRWPDKENPQRDYNTINQANV